MTHPGGGSGPRPSGPAGPSPARPDDPVDRILAAITPEVQAIADSLPDQPPSVFARIADIWRRNSPLRRFDRAA